MDQRKYITREAGFRSERITLFRLYRGLILEEVAATQGCDNSCSLSQRASKRCSRLRGDLRNALDDLPPWSAAALLGSSAGRAKHLRDHCVDLGRAEGVDGHQCFR
jgi:hypothetical protein